jgi:hypothetical protein
MEAAENACWDLTNNWKIFRETPKMLMMTSVYCSIVLGIYFGVVTDVNIRGLHFLNFHEF